MIKRGDIFYVDFPKEGNPFILHQGRHPALVISNDYNNCFAKEVIVLPMRSARDVEPKPYHIKIEGYGLDHASELLCEKPMTIQKRMLKGENWIGKIDNKDILERAVQAIVKQIS